MIVPFTRTATTAGGAPTWRTWVGLIVLPVLVMSLFLWAFWSPQSNHGSAIAAVVNDDQPVTLDGRVIPLGRQLAANLTTSRSPYTWVLTDAEGARDGLSRGDYAAVVTIPQDFSQKATSSATTKPLQPGQAQLRVQTSNSTGVADPLVSTQIAQVVLDTLNQQIVKTYLDKVYLSFNDVHDQIGQAAEAARRLADGAAKLHSGAGQLAGGTGQLASGLGQARNQLNDARSQVDAVLAPIRQQLPPPPPGGPLSQLERLAAGVDAAASGASHIDVGARQLDAGLGQLSSGADELAKRLGQGRDAVPTYDQSQRGELTDVVATPAIAITDHTNLGAAVAGFAVTLALWACALSTYVATRALPPSVLTSRESTRCIVARAVAPGATVAGLAAITLSAILVPVLRLGTSRWLLLLGVVVLSAFAFVALNQAAAAIFGRVGRFASIAVLVLAIATSLTSTVPATLHGIGEHLPTHAAMLAMRGVILGSDTWIAGATELGAWLLAAAVTTLLVTEQRRLLASKQLRIGRRRVNDV